MPRKGRRASQQAVVVCPIDPMEGCKVPKGSLYPGGATVDSEKVLQCLKDGYTPQSEDQELTIERMMDSVEMDEATALSIEFKEKLSISSLTAHASAPNEHIDWWHRNTKNHQEMSKKSFQRISSKILKGDLWRPEPRKEHWNKIKRAREQLVLILQILRDTEFKKANFTAMNSDAYQIYAFGGILSFGLWDGESDVDFCCVSESTMEQPEAIRQQLAAPLVRAFAKCLKSIAWKKSGLFSITGAKVPILKHNSGHFRKSYFTGCSVETRQKGTKLDKIAEKLREIAQTENPSAEKTLMNEKISRFDVKLNSGNEVLQMLPKITAIGTGAKINGHFFQPLELSQMDFDLSFSGAGIRNSWLLRTYLLQDPLVRLGALYIKRWSKKSAVNYGPGGYLCSYAFVIMWIYYIVFERRILNFIDPETIPMIPRQCKDLQNLYAPLPKFDVKTSSSLTELIYGFFHFYTSVFDWSTNVVSVRRASGTTREEINWQQTMKGRSTYFYMCVEDPYKYDLNLGRNLNEKRATQTIKSFNLWIADVQFHAKTTKTESNAS